MYGKQGCDSKLFSFHIVKHYLFKYANNYNYQTVGAVLFYLYEYSKTKKY